MRAYSPESLDDNFRKSHSEILSIKRGNGLWLWKPYVILDALEHVSEGDYVFYCDSGAFFFSNVMPLIDSMGESDIWVSDIPYIEEQWTKPEVFTRLEITDPAIKSSQQIQGSFVIARKSEMSCEFIREWLRLCTQPELIKPLELGEYHGECIEHREDQSLLSVLCKIRGIKSHRNPAVLPLGIKRRIKTKIKKLLGIPIKWQEARYVKLIHESDKYSPCIYHHRIRRADSILSVFLQVIRGTRLRVIAALIRMAFTKTPPKIIKRKRHVI